MQPPIAPSTPWPAIWPASAPAAPPDKQPIACADWLAAPRLNSVVTTKSAFRIGGLLFRSRVVEHHRLTVRGQFQGFAAILKLVRVFLDLGSTMLCAGFGFQRRPNFLPPRRLEWVVTATPCLDSLG